MKDEASYGGWYIDEGVVWREAPCRYEVDLDRCKTSAEVLDWIAQIAQKTWATDRILAGLVRALDVAVGGLQASICGNGIDNDAWMRLRPGTAAARAADERAARQCGKYLGDNDGTCPNLSCIRKEGHEGLCDNVRGDS